MKVIILAGGLGTRLQEETTVKPKPMVSIGGKPVLWHIMKIYASYGFNEFAIALGYKGEVIKDYFLNYRYRTSSLTIQLLTGDVSIRQDRAEDWTVHLLDTGETTQTGGRIRRVIQSLNPKEPVMLTYGDGVANLDLHKLLDFHKSHGKLATITAVRPPARFGDIAFDGNLVTQFEEKPQSGGGWINGGFLILEPGVIDYIDADTTLFEQEPLERLAADRQLAAYKHEGFWQCMDTLRDVRLLESLWNSDHAPWKVW
ncbi:MAG: glucose-1-phosphate cytidylyltransferase [Phormidium sp. BM_Day4_Bin.17]|nr:glucose-1-phosphate cytidylyltransferase [Phormidium sp. BM_Day4_Bin.17]UCJ11968.1 MAG: glucose-1-phosphate cytidylyltransferase [Phormidium sp. PBR-2020]